MLSESPVTTDIVWFALIVLLVFGIIVLLKQRVYFLTYYHFLSKPYAVARFVRSNTSLVVFLLTISVVSISWQIGHKPIVTATVFYATSLFLFNILSNESPFPIIVYDQSYLDSDHGESDEEGFQYVIKIQNNGGVRLVDPIVEYRLYTATYNEETNGWKSISNKSSDPLVLEPGDTTKYKIVEEPVSGDCSTDYYILFRFRPKRRHREVGIINLFPVGGG